MKAKPRTEAVEQIRGLTSRELQDRCPDQRTAFPTRPCTNVDCQWRIKSKAYLNCAFVAFEAADRPPPDPDKDERGLTLEEIGEVMGITREGVRLIQIRAQHKIGQTLGLTDE